jgi:alpha-1,2-mannosyltransferase
MGSAKSIRARDETVSTRRGTWRVSPGMAMLVATVIALGIRLFTLSRPGFLTSSTEYDDGVYLGAAIRLTQGVLPYRDFAFVQPPGILLLMSPVAVFSRLTSTVDGMALARVLTALASAACVPLVGHLVRYRGTLVTALTCAILAIYPPDIASAHTLLLEPWMNLLCLLGANAAFSSGRLAARPGRLAWAGVAIGVAGAVKFWAGAPAVVLLVICLITRDELRRRRTVAYLGALAGGFIIPLAPFFFSAPAAFVKSTIFYQAARVGTYTPLSLRLAHITGLIDILNYHGTISLTAGGNSLFADGVIADTAPAIPHLLPYLATLVLAAVIAAGFLVGRRDTTTAEWFALATSIMALAAILGYSAFFYHYPAFPGPWLAIIAGVALGHLCGLLSVTLRTAATGLVAVVLAAVAILQLTEVAQVTVPTGIGQIDALIPPGACVVSDTVSFTIAANRFTAAKPGCPVVIDSLATTLVLTHGVSVQGGADKDASAVTAWRDILLRAQYVWMSTNHWRRIPFGWNTPQWTWFTDHFRQIAPAAPAGQNSTYLPDFGQLFERDSG